MPLLICTTFCLVSRILIKDMCFLLFGFKNIDLKYCALLDLASNVLILALQSNNINSVLQITLPEE